MAATADADDETPPSQATEDPRGHRARRTATAWIIGTVQGYSDGTAPDGPRFDVRDDQPGAAVLTVTVGPGAPQDVRQAAACLKDGSRVYIRISPARDRILEIRPL